jgi:hypothetical protein
MVLFDRCSLDKIMQLITLVLQVKTMRIALKTVMENYIILSQNS